MLRKNLLSLYDTKYDSHRHYCGIGKHITCWTAEGVEYPCIRFSPISTSRPLQDISMAEDIVNQKCASCPVERLCLTCEAYNYEINGSCFNRTTFHCDFSRLDMLAAARLMILDEGDSLWQLPNSSEGSIDRLKKMLIIRSMNDLCKDLIEQLSL